MDLTYTEWKPMVDAHNRKHTIYCPNCSMHSAVMMTRFMTGREGDTERQYRVECAACKKTGKTYLHESVAEMSWEARENDPPPKPVYKRGKWIG